MPTLKEVEVPIDAANEPAESKSETKDSSLPSISNRIVPVSAVTEPQAVPVAAVSEPVPVSAVTGPAGSIALEKKFKVTLSRNTKSGIKTKEVKVPVSTVTKLIPFQCKTMEFEVIKAPLPTISTRD